MRSSLDQAEAGFDATDAFVQTVQAVDDVDHALFELTDTDFQVAHVVIKRINPAANVTQMLKRQDFGFGGHGLILYHLLLPVSLTNWAGAKGAFGGPGTDRAL